MKNDVRLASFFALGEFMYGGGLLARRRGYEVKSTKEEQELIAKCDAQRIEEAKQKRLRRMKARIK